MHPLLREEYRRLAPYRCLDEPTMARLDELGEAVTQRWMACWSSLEDADSRRKHGLPTAAEERAQARGEMTGRPRDRSWEPLMAEDHL